MRASVILLALALCAPAFAKEKSRPKAPPDYYPMPTGATWNYTWKTADGKTGGFDIKVLPPVKEGATTYLLAERKTGQTTLVDWYSKPEGWVLMHKQVNPNPQAPQLQFTPPRQLLKRPLKIGDTWPWTGTGLMNQAIQEESTVEGDESVTVPAGTFSTIRVATRITQGDTITNKKWWFAPGVGMVRSTTDNGTVQSTTELVKSSLLKR